MALKLTLNPLATPEAIKRFNKPLTKREKEKIFRPYAIELGYLVYAWNHLQETLAELFWRVSGIPKQAAAFAIWHSIPSDRYQRLMLEAAAEKTIFDKTKLEDIHWLMKKLNKPMSGQRNDAVHAPMIFFTDLVGTTLRPYDWTGNPRALSLAGKNVTQELLLYRKRTEILREYAKAMHRHLGAPAIRSWPDRPKLPRPEDVTDAKAQLRKSAHR